MSSVAGRGRTCGAPRFRRALYRAELRPRAVGQSPSVHLPSRGDRRSGGRSCRCRASPDDGAVFHATRSPFDPGSSTIGCASTNGRRPTWRSSGARPSGRSGKSPHEFNPESRGRYSRERVEPFSLERGLDPISSFFKLGITFSCRHRSPPKRRRRPIGSPSREVVLRQRSSAFASPRGLPRAPTCAGSLPAHAGSSAMPRRLPRRRGTWS